MICIPPQKKNSADNQVVFRFFPYLLILSSVFLVITFLVYAIIRELRNIHGIPKEIISMMIYLTFNSICYYRSEYYVLRCFTCHLLHRIGRHPIVSFPARWSLHWIR